MTACGAGSQQPGGGHQVAVRHRQAVQQDTGRRACADHPLAYVQPPGADPWPATDGPVRIGRCRERRAQLRGAEVARAATAKPVSGYAVRGCVSDGGTSKTRARIVDPPPTAGRHRPDPDAPGCQPVVSARSSASARRQSSTGSPGSRPRSTKIWYARAAIASAAGAGAVSLGAGVHAG
jgi:hypothetical protein